MHKLFELAGNTLRGVSQICSLNAGQDVPVLETPFKK